MLITKPITALAPGVALGQPAMAHEAGAAMAKTHFADDGLHAPRFAQR